MPLKSQKLDRTLHDLESAISDWHSVIPSKNTASPDKALPAKAVASDEDFRKKTKKLLSQLREQLAELEDD